MSESGDYDPGPWKGYNFQSARKSYDVHVGRSYDDAVSKKVSVKNVLEKRLETKSSSPLVIACDVTGSMGEWPATIFSKLPYLDLEGKEYLGEDMEISFAAIGDAYTDTYALQVRPFDTGKNLEKRLKELIIEGGGGGQGMETYELAAAYYANNVDMPKATKPVFIFIGDEGLYDTVNKKHAKEYCGLTLEKDISTKSIMKELQNKYSVYLIRKPYQNAGDSMSSADQHIYKQWEEVLGADHISVLPEAGRVVDVIFGILAKETERVDYFKKELTERQKPGQVNTVMKALGTIHNPKSVKKLSPGKSVMKRATAGGDGDDDDEAKSLL